MSLRQEVNIAVQVSLHGEDKFVLEGTLGLQRVIFQRGYPIMNLLLEKGQGAIFLIEICLGNLKDKFVVDRVKLFEGTRLSIYGARIPSQRIFIPLLTSKHNNALGL